MGGIQHMAVFLLAAVVAPGCGPRAVVPVEPGQPSQATLEVVDQETDVVAGNIDFQAPPPEGFSPPQVTTAAAMDPAGEDSRRLPMRELLAFASKSILDSDRNISEDEIINLNSEDRELLETMQSWFADVGENLGNDEDAWKVMEAASDSLQKQLKRGPELKLPSVALCTRVGGFGDYDEWGNRTGDEIYSFVAHAGQPVIIYAEMEGVSSDLNDRKLWETITSQHLVIFSERDGIPLWEEQWQTAADRSQVRRKNYFTTQVVELPPALSAGKYHLRLRVRDEKNGAEAEHSIRFTMAPARRK